MALIELANSMLNVIIDFMKNIFSFFSRNIKQNNLVQTINKVYVSIDDIRKKNMDNVNYEWLNLGYWENTNYVSEACENLVKIVAELSELKSNDTVLDVGFGYGLQDIFWAKKISNIKVFGLNIVDTQVKHAQKLVKKNNLSKNVFLNKGDAVHTKFSSNSFDKVFAVESALHFNTRELFLREAFRVLKTDGVICLTDVLPKANAFNDDNIKEICTEIGIPHENLYGIDKYVEILEEIGFRNIYVRDISEWVFPFSMAAYENINNRGSKEANIVNDRKETLKLWRENYYPKTGLYSYYIIKATK